MQKQVKQEKWTNFKAIGFNGININVYTHHLLCKESIARDF